MCIQHWPSGSHYLKLTISPRVESAHESQVASGLCSLPNKEGTKSQKENSAFFFISPNYFLLFQLFFKVIFRKLRMLVGYRYVFQPQNVLIVYK